MNYTDYIEYLPYAVAFVLAVPFLIYMRQFLHTYIRLKEKELSLLSVNNALQNRMQAYERLMLFLERIKPASLVQRFDKSLQPHEFVFLLEKVVNEEFEYNSSLQLYVSKTLWQNIVSCKNNINQLSHRTLEGLGENANLEEYKTLFLMNYVNGQDFIAHAQDDLKKEALKMK